MRNRYKITDDGRYAVIYIRCNGQERATIISADDLPRAMEIPTSWYGEMRDWTMYVRCCFGSPRKYAYLHRWLMQPSEDNEVDHADHDGMNNTRDNLNEVTPAENLDNRRENCDKYAARAYRWYEADCKDYYNSDDQEDDLIDDLPF